MAVRRAIEAGDVTSERAEVHAPADVQALASQVAADWDVGHEKEADDVATDAVRRITGSIQAPVQDGRLGGQLQTALGAVRPDLRGLDQVRFDTGAAAAGVADAIDARALTSHGRVAVGTGELRQDRDGAELAAHEAVHAAGHDDGGVHAKLRGTREALEQLGGEPAKGNEKKLIGKKNWDLVLEGVGAYEAIEDVTLAWGRNPTPQELSQLKPQMLRTLGKVKGAIKKWQTANDEERQTRVKERQRTEYTKDPFAEKPEGDERVKAPRRQAINLLVPRVNNEIKMLESDGAKEWLDSMGLDSTTGSLTGVSDEGMKAKPRELKYITENGEFYGWFKEDKGFDSKLQMYEAKSGVDFADPNFGARAIAMHKLDKLLKSNVIARAEFATHVNEQGQTVLGTVLESGTGNRANRSKVGFSEEETEEIGGLGFGFDDPGLQRAMNKLQIFDVIVGQLDRHPGNYFIQVDGKGHVTGVTGIDQDMSFGKDYTDIEQQPNGALNAKAMPAYIDAEFGRALLQISASDIADCLEGLLSQAEIDATIARFEQVKAVIQDMEDTGSLTEEWNEETAWERMPTVQELTFATSRKTYMHDLALKSLDTIRERVGEAVRQAMRGGGSEPFDASGLRTLGELPEDFVPIFVEGLGINDGLNGVSPFVAEWVFDSRQLGSGREVELAMLLLNELLADEQLRTTMVDYFEKHPDEKDPVIPGMFIRRAIIARNKAMLGRAVAKLSPWEDEGTG